MWGRAIAIGLLAALAGCQSPAPTPIPPSAGEAGASLTLFKARLQLGLAMPRRVQTLPDFWDQAVVKVDTPRLKTPAIAAMPTATASLTPPLSLPLGPATVSIELKSQGVLMATGSIAATLVSGMNPLTISMAPLLDRVVTLAGNGTTGAVNGVGGQALFNGPRGMVLDGVGNLIVADTSNHVIRKVTPTGVVSTIAGALGTSGFADGAAGTARFNGPSGVAFRAGYLFVADTGNNRIRMINPMGVVSTLAGSGSAGSANATGTSAMFNQPWGIAVTSAGDLLVSDFQNNLIRKIATPSLTVTTHASTFLNGPSGVAIDSLDSLIVANYFSSEVLRVSIGGTVSVAGGVGTAGFSGDGGPATSAAFNQPRAVAVDPGDHIYVADTFNYRIRRIQAGSGVVTTVAGAGTSGFLDGPSNLAQFGALFGIAVRGPGDRLYVSDTTNQRLRVRLAP